MLFIKLIIKLKTTDLNFRFKKTATTAEVAPCLSKVAATRYEIKPGIRVIVERRQLYIFSLALIFIKSRTIRLSAKPCSSLVKYLKFS
jgi:hypothetical protein